ncbi:hypothetical protein C4572_00210 [Candidatus Parcubacteria bacterium]|nr:MAG: hypothetical protein C4572_00210 [Candidatus Parcubacteria bacterium]
MIHKKLKIFLFLLLILLIIFPSVSSGVLCDKDGCDSGDYDIGLPGWLVNLLIITTISFITLITFFVVKKIKGLKKQ